MLSLRSSDHLQVICFYRKHHITSIGRVTQVFFQFSNFQFGISVMACLRNNLRATKYRPVWMKVFCLGDFPLPPPIVNRYYRGLPCFDFLDFFIPPLNLEKVFGICIQIEMIRWWWFLDLILAFLRFYVKQAHGSHCKTT